MVFNIGEANKLPAYSMELGVSPADDRHLACVDRILEIAARWARDGVFHTSPIALRFVAPSSAYASMMAGRPTSELNASGVFDSPFTRRVGIS